MRRRRKSITARLTLLFAAISTMVLLALGLLIGNAVEQHFVEQDMEQMTGKLDLAGHLLEKVQTPAISMRLWHNSTIHWSVITASPCSYGGLANRRCSSLPAPAFRQPFWCATPSRVRPSRKSGNWTVSQVHNHGAALPPCCRQESLAGNQYLSRWQSTSRTMNTSWLRSNAHFGCSWLSLPSWPGSSAGLR